MHRNEYSNIHQLSGKPQLLLDKEKCRSNIAFMAARAERMGLFLRPHFKTHQSLQIAEWFRESGTSAITVSSVTMADYFIRGGWKDVCIAFPFNLLEMNHAVKLSAESTLHLTVCSVESLRFIKKYATRKTGIRIKIDTGYNRTGIWHEDTAIIETMLAMISESSKLEFTGFMVHNGHTYNCRSKDEIETIHSTSNSLLVKLKERYEGDFGKIILSTGDTPSCSIAEKFDGIDEIRPGNYVFYDLTQTLIGSCSPDRVAVCLAVPVVARHSNRNEIVVYGGAVHLSKESVAMNNGTNIYGIVVELDKRNSWGDPVPDTWVSRLSQEHGIIRCSSEFFNRIHPGDMIGIIPVHSCLTADLMKGYLSTDGQKIEHLSGQAG